MLSSSEALAFYVHVPALAFYEYVFISCRILTVVVDTAPDAATYSEAVALQVHVRLTGWSTRARLDLFFVLVIFDLSEL